MRDFGVMVMLWVYLQRRAEGRRREIGTEFPRHWRYRAENVARLIPGWSAGSAPPLVEEVGERVVPPYGAAPSKGSGRGSGGCWCGGAGRDASGCGRPFGGGAATSRTCPGARFVGFGARLGGPGPAGSCPGWTD